MLRVEQDKLKKKKKIINDYLIQQLECLSLKANPLMLLITRSDCFMLNLSSSV